ncbi:MAG: Rrf2 family transcriptional regulator [Calditrichaeota bacterium]|nr:Rrf2 family transcriptional regulator [Calditrichota bacterium]MCB0291297.1 Rrf2 family transcriptional regulator [Calditrichota bacterium]MCB0296808.1 Rrf2 family transcriptional regulator [Calditrichota bacterium]MCB0305555.1 Rrf2 family transcriptional regulator [Calditrichota bacterium]MCB9088076.1 Rrf2 family transcriptional regulator [Calditrichia bacterium]
MMFSKACVYGLRAALYVATLDKQAFVPIKTISDHLDISFHFLTKILQTLTQHHIMLSYRGPNGGIALARPAEQINAIQIVEAIDGTRLFSDCILDLPGCGTQRPCPMHEQWSRIRSEMKHLLETTTLAGLSERISQFDLRITADEGGLNSPGG